MKFLKFIFNRKQSISRVPRKKYYPLSFQQESIWLSIYLGNKNDLWNISSVRNINEHIEEEIIKIAFDELVKRNTILRTNITLIDNIPYQFISTVSKNLYSFYDLSKSENTNHLEEIIEDDEKKPFDIEKDRLVRLILIKKSETNFSIYCNLHHIISDNATIAIFWKELFSIYYSILNNSKSELNKLEYQYHDYSYWQKKVHVKEFLKYEKYWFDEFSGNLPKTEIIPDFIKNENIKTFGTATCDFDSEITTHLRKFSFANKVLPSSTLLAMYSILINRYTNEDDMIIGIPFSGRQYKQHDLIGCYARLCALRFYFDKKLNVREFISYIHNKVEEAYNNQDYPLQMLVKKVNPPRSDKNSPLFQNVYNYISNKFIDENNISHIVESVKEGSSKYDINFTIYELKNHLKIEIAYNSSLYKRETIIRFLNHFKKLLNITLNPLASLSNVSIILEEEKELIIENFNNTNADYPKNKTILQFFEEQVKSSPSSIAVICEEKEITYSELNDKANQLGKLLRDNGIGRNSLVAIMTERSIDMIIGIFGIIKSGGAYLPIDPNYPDERKKYMINNSGCKILLTQSKFLNNISGEFKIIDIEDDGIYSKKPEELNLINSSSDLAYVIYTSGSTGNPKGVMIEHGSLVNRLNWMQKKYPINHDDTLLQKTSYTFDVSVWEIFWWSMVGSKLCMLRPGGEKEPNAIVQTIEKQKITILHFVPSMLNIFLDYITTEDGLLKRLTSVKQVITSGEALLPLHVEMFNNTIGKEIGSKLSNLYGPTEATIDVTYYDCPKDNPINMVPIGKPIDNTQIYILNKDNQLQPIGISGELCIGGVGLAKGYLQNDLLTHEKFSPNPFKEGERIYKTGDLAKWLPDGNIEYLGRIDRQIKLRGYRIEPQEIEMELLKLNELKECVVIPQDIKNSNILLIAYYVSGDNHSSMELRSFLKKSLPDYLIPARFIKVIEIPKQTTGKVDVEKLKALFKAENNNSKNFREPKSKNEILLSKIWKGSLLIDKISVEDNFFDLGGHSLMLVKVINQIKKETGVIFEFKDFINQNLSQISYLLGNTN